MINTRLIEERLFTTLIGIMRIFLRLPKDLEATCPKSTADKSLDYPVLLHITLFDGGSISTKKFHVNKILLPVIIS